MKEVYGTIRKLGATSKYKGYYFVAEAIRMTMEFQERPMKITKDIYPRLAKKFKSKPSNIEHDIRTIVNVCWENLITTEKLRYILLPEMVQFFAREKGLQGSAGSAKKGFVFVLKVQI